MCVPSNTSRPPFGEAGWLKLFKSSSSEFRLWTKLIGNLYFHLHRSIQSHVTPTQLPYWETDFYFYSIRISKNKAPKAHSALLLHRPKNMSLLLSLYSSVTSDVHFRDGERERGAYLINIIIQPGSPISDSPRESGAVCVHHPPLFSWDITCKT